MARFRMVLFAASAALASAQYINHRVPGTPRTKDGKPNLSAPVRKVNGRPDLSGIWQGAGQTDNEALQQLAPGAPPLKPGEPVNGLGEDVPSKHFFDILLDFPKEQSPLLPSAVAAYAKNAAALGKDAPDSNCLPVIAPMIYTGPTPYKIVQTPGLILILAEADGRFRQIFTDGRQHPEERTPSWAGYSIGRWEGDTLLVDTIGFNDRSWLDVLGHMHSDALHLTERFRRRDFGHMDIEVTIDDPKTYARPFTVKLPQRLRPDTDLIEYVCAENERDKNHIEAGFK